MSVDATVGKLRQHTIKVVVSGGNAPWHDVGNESARGGCNSYEILRSWKERMTEVRCICSEDCIQPGVTYSQRWCVYMDSGRDKPGSAHVVEVLTKAMMMFTKCIDDPWPWWDRQYPVCPGTFARWSGGSESKTSTHVLHVQFEALKSPWQPSRPISSS